MVCRRSVTWYIRSLFRNFVDPISGSTSAAERISLTKRGTVHQLVVRVFGIQNSYERKTDVRI